MRPRWVPHAMADWIVDTLHVYPPVTALEAREHIARADLWRFPDRALTAYAARRGTRIPNPWKKARTNR